MCRGSSLILVAVLAACGGEREPPGEARSPEPSSPASRVETERRFSHRGESGVCRETWGRPPSSNAPSDADRWLEEPCPRGSAVATCTTERGVEYHYAGDERRSEATERARRRCRGGFEAVSLASCEALLREYFDAMRTIELDGIESRTEEDGHVVAVARGRRTSERPLLERPHASTELGYLRRRAVDWAIDEPRELDGRLEVRCVRYPDAGD